VTLYVLAKLFCLPIIKAITIEVVHDSDYSDEKDHGGNIFDLVGTSIRNELSVYQFSIFRPGLTD
jgi:hypothetical protein